MGRQILGKIKKPALSDTAIHEKSKQCAPQLPPPDTGRHAALIHIAAFCCYREEGWLPYTYWLYRFTWHHNSVPAVALFFVFKSDFLIWRKKSLPFRQITRPFCMNKFHFRDHFTSVLRLHSSGHVHSMFIVQFSLFFSVHFFLKTRSKLGICSL